MTKFSRAEKSFIKQQMESMEVIRDQYAQLPPAPAEKERIAGLIARFDAYIKAFKHALES